MINKATEVIFIDEASISTMEIDDWKILTQGGYTAAHVKHQTAKSFINRCPMLLTAQQFLGGDKLALSIVSTDIIKLEVEPPNLACT